MLGRNFEKIERDGESPRKRQKLDVLADKRSLTSPIDSDPREIYASPTVPSDSAFATSPADVIQKFPEERVLGIAKYIQAGCLRLWRTDTALSLETWQSCGSWAAVRAPPDVYNPNKINFLSNALQEELFNCPSLNRYRGLSTKMWIRMEFKTQDMDHGQLRVYILPDDVGRAKVRRDSKGFRAELKFLLTQLDIRRETWHGEWDDDFEVVHVDSSLNSKRIKDDPTLFEMFNDLPSPNPNPEVVTSLYAKNAMYNLLSGDVPGLKTSMYQYQRRTAALMLQREAQPARIIDPRLISVHDQRGVTWYCDIFAATCLVDPRTYESAPGGVCAETMGLGKTLICLSLILATRDLPSHIPVEHSVGTIPIRKRTGTLMEICASTAGRSGTPWKNFFLPLEAQGIDMANCKLALKDGAGFYSLPPSKPKRSTRNVVSVAPKKVWLTTATIVVVPSNLIVQWQEEIAKHTTAETLKVIVLQGRNPIPPAKELADYDIILFTKERFKAESRDGQDDQGRRAGSSNKICTCVYAGYTTSDHDCIRFKEDVVYRSPLRDLHFKRLITDEGHSFGNSSSGNVTDALAVVDGLRLDARWIVSGTPTSGLYGAEVAGTQSRPTSGVTTPDPKLQSSQPLEKKTVRAKEIEKLFYEQERNDLKKLGNIATYYLKARPWANPTSEGDAPSWDKHVIQPKHGSKSHGNLNCLRATLTSMIIRHRPEDVGKEVELPPLYQDVTYLEGSMQDKLSLNTFSMMIVSNAVTSERKDADYLFHPRQVKHLQHLVSNLRQASFFWSGFKHLDVISAMETSKGFLEKEGTELDESDRKLLQGLLVHGKLILQNGISKAISEFHEMPIYIENEFSNGVRDAWSLDGKILDPTLMTGAAVNQFRGYVETNEHVSMAVFADGLCKLGHVNKMLMEQVKDSSERNNKTDPALPNLAGGVTLGEETTPKKRTRLSTARPVVPETTTSNSLLNATLAAKSRQKKKDISILPGPDTSVLDAPLLFENMAHESNQLHLDYHHKVREARLVSTASAKLTYLLDKICLYQGEEKILVFYEADNVAYYIREALTILGIEHLTYHKKLTVKERATQVVLFNGNPKYRVLIMDVSQAAFGLDLSAASRVYFVNPILNPQIEAQAVKRAHRIGQRKPVYVETLVLRGSMEEIILDRRSKMTNEEHQKCKNILDDEVIYDWIRKVRFLDFPQRAASGPEQMAVLSPSQGIFKQKTGAEGPTTGTESGLRADVPEEVDKQSLIGHNGDLVGCSQVQQPNYALPIMHSTHSVSKIGVSFMEDHLNLHSDLVDDQHIV